MKIYWFLLPVLFILLDVGNSELKSKPGYAEVKQSCKLECDDGYFLCEKNKTCVYEHWRCDGVIDCSTSEDELNCTHYTKKDGKFFVLLIISRLLCFHTFERCIHFILFTRQHKIMAIKNDVSHDK